MVNLIFIVQQTKSETIIEGLSLILLTFFGFYLIWLLLGNKIIAANIEAKTKEPVYGNTNQPVYDAKPQWFKFFIYTLIFILLILILQKYYPHP